MYAEPWLESGRSAWLTVPSPSPLNQPKRGRRRRPDSPRPPHIGPEEARVSEARAKQRKHINIDHTSAGSGQSAILPLASSPRHMPAERNPSQPPLPSSASSAPSTLRPPSSAPSRARTPSTRSSLTARGPAPPSRPSHSPHTSSARPTPQPTPSTPSLPNTPSSSYFAPWRSEPPSRGRYLSPSARSATAPTVQPIPLPAHSLQAASALAALAGPDTYISGAPRDEGSAVSSGSYCHATVQTMRGCHVIWVRCGQCHVCVAEQGQVLVVKMRCRRGQKALRAVVQPVYCCCTGPCAAPWG